MPTTSTATTKTAKTVDKGHRSITAGSRKEKIAMAFDNRGPDAALKEADKLGVKSSTARSWFSAWRKVKAASTSPAPSRRRTKKSA